MLRKLNNIHEMAHSLDEMIIMVNDELNRQKN